MLFSIHPASHVLLFIRFQYGALPLFVFFFVNFVNLPRHWFITISFSDTLLYFRHFFSEEWKSLNQYFTFSHDFHENKIKLTFFWKKKSEYRHAINNLIMSSVNVKETTKIFFSWLVIENGLKNLDEHNMYRKTQTISLTMICIYTDKVYFYFHFIWFNHILLNSVFSSFPALRINK